jgi:hypothetical protein
VSYGCGFFELENSKTENSKQKTEFRIQESEIAELGVSEIILIGASKNVFRRLGKNAIGGQVLLRPPVEARNTSRF